MAASGCLNHGIAIDRTGERDSEHRDHRLLGLRAVLSSQVPSSESRTADHRQSNPSRESGLSRVVNGERVNLPFEAAQPRRPFPTPRSILLTKLSITPDDTDAESKPSDVMQANLWRRLVQLRDNYIILYETLQNYDKIQDWNRRSPRVTSEPLVYTQFKTRNKLKRHCPQSLSDLIRIGAKDLDVAAAV